MLFLFLAQAATARSHIIRDDLHTGRLVAVLENFRPPAKEPLYLLFQERKHIHPRVRALIEFMEAGF